MVVDGGCSERLVDLASPHAALPCGVGISPTLELQIHAGAFGYIGDCLGEVEGLQFHYELDGVPAALASETVVEAAVWGDTKGGGFLLVIGVGAEA